MSAMPTADKLKKAFCLIALLALCLSVACSQPKQTAERVNLDNAPAASPAADTGNAGTGNTNAAAVAVSPNTNPNTNQTNEQAAEAENLLLTQPTGFVNDFAKVLDARTKTRLEALVGKLKARANIEFAIVTVKTTGKQDIYDYSLALARSWGVGSKPGGDGLLLMVATEDRKWRIQVSRSLEADLPNDVVGELGRLMTEPFRRKNYGEGLTKCVEALIARLGERRGFEMK
jgi:hypothetical protein